MNKRKVLAKILSGAKNIRFEDFLAVAEAFGFVLDRVSGSHHILKHPNIPELLNLQNRKGQAKPYQMRQFLLLVDQNDLQMED